MPNVIPGGSGQVGAVIARALSAEGHEIVALVSSDKKVQAGENVEFSIQADKLHVFDPETELNLTARG